MSIAQAIHTITMAQAGTDKPRLVNIIARALVVGMPTVATASLPARGTIYQFRDGSFLFLGMAPFFAIGSLQDGPTLADAVEAFTRACEYVERDEATCSGGPDCPMCAGGAT